MKHSVSHTIKGQIYLVFINLKNLFEAINAEKKAYSAFFSTAFFAGLAGLALPNDPLNIFPFLVFLSPLPMLMIFFRTANVTPTSLK